MAKYPQWTGKKNEGRVEALLNLLGEKNARRFLAGELMVEWREAIRKFFDRYGIRVPKNLNLQAKFCDPNRDFHLVQPSEIDYAARLERVRGFFPADLVWPSVAEWEDTCEAQLEQIGDDEQVKNALNGVHLPLCLPHMPINNLGQVLEEVFLAAVAKAYTQQFPRRTFHNYRAGELAGQVSVVQGSRHDQLLAQMAEATVKGIHFPNPLQGFSMHASREQMSTLPEVWILSGLDTIMAMAMWTDVLVRDYHTPGLDLAAFSWGSALYSLYFWAHVDELGFDGTDGLANAYDNYSAGLFLLR